MKKGAEEKIIFNQIRGLDKVLEEMKKAKDQNDAI